jgi:hypothetical protein
MKWNTNKQFLKKQKDPSTYNIDTNLFWKSDMC